MSALPNVRNASRDVAEGLRRFERDFGRLQRATQAAVDQGIRETPEGHECKDCPGACPECWCLGCHDGYDFPEGRWYEIDDGNPCGSWLAFEELQRAERRRREVAPLPGQLGLEFPA